MKYTLLKNSITFSYRISIEKLKFSNTIIYLIIHYLYIDIKCINFNRGFQLVYQVDGNTIVLVLEQGEDIVEAVTDLAREQNGKFGTVSGIGACDNVELNFYNLETKTYEKKEIKEPLELISLLGN